MVVVPGKLRGQLPLDGGGALELVVDLHTQAPPGLLELGCDVGRPLSGMSSELSHLEHHAEKTQRDTHMTVSILCALSSDCFIVVFFFKQEDGSSPL